MEHLWSSISLAIEAFTESVDYGKCTLDNSIEDSCYSRYSPMASGLFFCYCFVVYSFVWSVVGQNVSKVDQIWSITPVVYVWHFFLHQVFAKGVLHFRALVIAVLGTYTLSLFVVIATPKRPISVKSTHSLATNFATYCSDSLGDTIDLQFLEKGRVRLPNTI